MIRMSHHPPFFDAGEKEKSTDEFLKMGAGKRQLSERPLHQNQHGDDKMYGSISYLEELESISDLEPTPLPEWGDFPYDADEKRCPCCDGCGYDRHCILCRKCKGQGVIPA